MKLYAFIILAIFSLSSGAVALTIQDLIKADSITRGQLLQVMTEIAIVCQKRVGASLADLLDLKAQKPAKSQTAKCLRACVLDDATLYAGNKLDVAKLKKLVQALRAEFPGKLKGVHGIVEECAALSVPAKKCDNAEIYLTCLKEKGDKLGVNILLGS